jgi:catalase
MKTRLQHAPAEWDLVFQMAEPGDPTDDMTKQWPERRRQITVGRLVVDRVHEDQEAADKLVYDPTNVPPGIEPSADPVLHFRSHVYAGSFDRRTSEVKPTIVPE